MITSSKPEPVRRNVYYSVLDYVSQPATMILAAPILLKTMGVQQYGTWMLVNSIAATASGLAGGFGDGATKFISMYRGRDDREGVARSLLAALMINSALSFLLVIGLVACAPLLVRHVFQVEPLLRHDAIVAVRISAFVLVLRFAQAIFTSAVRAYERYRPVVLTTVSSRLLIVFLAIILTSKGFGLVAILWATLSVETIALIAQAVLAHIILPLRRLPAIDIQCGLGDIVGFGLFTWLKSATGVLFGYADRLVIAALLGTGPLAFYVLCNQLTQPIPTLLASSFNFIFPNFSARSAAGKWMGIERSYHAYVLVSLCIAAAVCFPMSLAARSVLTVWLGPLLAVKYHALLIAMAVGNGLLALSIVPQYTALAFGRARALAYINLAAGISSAVGGYVLVHRIGLIGGGFARVLAGMVSLSAFVVVRSLFKQVADSSSRSPNLHATVTPLDLVRS